MKLLQKSRSSLCSKSLCLNSDLPPQVPPPKFRFWQKVRAKDRCGHITGMEYIDTHVALIDLLDTHGWFYTVNSLYGCTTAEMLKAKHEPTLSIAESELEAVED
ncbi:hypothetical protein H6G00_01025 [Leptolyngbya sp. FACHB-541]|uniref:hypothetical protein n=1 Tax=Leptolyngbya sp. FACHB-541 TaxID=2692810 RepID=UPI0016848EC7|nr:hypothetical protein [Leptolyngbya sp. FACHB-541]MBD1995211.1 hypothetical protein [Leptolyngbya sp. FACHB-541]